MSDGNKDSASHRVPRCRSVRGLEDEPFQPFPRSGSLAANLNLDLDRLRARTGTGRDTVYCYVLTSVCCDDMGFVQYGSSPNFQGGVITLCTCKHQMRSRLAPEAWIGRWVAGFTGKNAVGDGRRYLVYLMRVAQAVESQEDLWVALPPRARLPKAARLHRHGDLFEPAQPLRDPFIPGSYKLPRPDHVHAQWDSWHKDIGHTGRSGRRPALLVGDPEYSFLWDRPVIPAPFNLPRDYRVRELGELLRQPGVDELR